MLTRRSLLTGAALGLPLAAANLTRGLRPARAQAAAPKTFVLARGSWHGGWGWKRVADRLRSKGHAVYMASYTGMGDRVDLLHKEITIETCIARSRRIRCWRIRDGSCVRGRVGSGLTWRRHTMP